MTSFPGAARALMERTGAQASLVHAAVDTLCNLLALLVTSANEQERAPVRQVAQAVQAARGQTVEIAFVNQGEPGEKPAQVVEQKGVRVAVVTLQQTLAWRCLWGGHRRCIV